MTTVALLLGAAALEKGLPASQPVVCPPAAEAVRFLATPEPPKLSRAMSIALPPIDLIPWPSVAMSEPIIEPKPEPVGEEEPRRARQKWRRHKRHRW